MKLEKFVSKMMSMSVMGRLWHWSTDVAQHHTTFESFLTQNEALTDSLVESSLGNNVAINFAEVGVENSLGGAYSIDTAKETISGYRAFIYEFKEHLESVQNNYSEELNSILDDATELCSKSLYLLRLS